MTTNQENPAGTENPQTMQAPARQAHTAGNPQPCEKFAQADCQSPRGRNDQNQSFGSLHDNDRLRADNAIRPDCAVRPIGREPNHGTLEYPGEDVTAIGNVIQLGTTVQHKRGNTLAADAALSAVGIGNQKDLLSHVHSGQNADNSPHCQQINVRIPLLPNADDNPRMKNELHDRIKQRLSDLNLSEEGASTAMGFNRSYLRKLFERPDSSPRGESLKKMAVALKCSEAWLLTGQDQSFTPAESLNGNTPHLPKGNTSSAHNVPPAPSRHDMTMDIPVMGTAAGSLIRGAFQLDGNIVDYVRRPQSLAGAKDIYALYVEGSSMEPQYFSGDLIYVNPHRPPRTGDIVVVQCQMSKHSEKEASLGVYVRRTEKVFVLGKRNPVGSEVEIDREYITEIHKVLTMNEIYGV